MRLAAEECHSTWLWQNERTLALAAFGPELLTQSPSYTGLLSSSLDTWMSPRAGDQAATQQKAGHSGCSGDVISHWWRAAWMEQL